MYCACTCAWFFIHHACYGVYTPDAEGDAEERAKALNMMRMLANRQNSRWLEAKEWDMPFTFDATKFPALLGTSSHALLAPTSSTPLYGGDWDAIGLSKASPKTRSMA